MSVPLAFDALLSLVTSLVYVHVGLLMVRRQVEPVEAQAAMRMFALWWFGLATYSLLDGLQSAMAAAGVLDLAAHAAVGYALLVPVLASVCGLLTYLLYIYTGRGGLVPLLGVLHGLLLVGLLYLVAWREPVAVQATVWTVQIAYARDPSPVVMGLALGSILVPVLVAAALYGTLFLRARDATTRYRVGMVSLAFLLWFGSVAAANASGLHHHEAWPVVSKLIGLGSTLLVLLAYRPPRWVQRRLGVEPLDLSPRRAEPQPDLGVSSAAVMPAQAEPSATSTTVLAAPRPLAV